MRISCLLLVLAACGGGGTSTQPTTPTNNTGSATVVEPAAPVENDTSICANRPEQVGPLVRKSRWRSAGSASRWSGS